MDMISLMTAASGAIVLPRFDPNLVDFGFFALRWYSLAYLAGLVFGWWYLKKQVKAPGSAMSPAHVDDFLFWATLGTIIGGRIGYVLFYNFNYYISEPAAILRMWDGGMSFHGGAIGVVVAVILFSLKNRISMFKMADLIALVAPVGLFLGRMANFVNGELWGRAADVPWAMIFPGDPAGLPRHPSQLYEAFLEGIVLFAILMFLWHKTKLHKSKPGFIAGTFWVGYGVFRFLIEYVREPDQHLLAVSEVITRGQLLCLPMIAFGVFLMWVGNNGGTLKKKS